MTKEELRAAIEAEQHPTGKAELIAQYEAEYGPYSSTSEGDSGNHIKHPSGL